MGALLIPFKLYQLILYQPFDHLVFHYFFNPFILNGLITVVARNCHIYCIDHAVFNWETFTPEEKEHFIAMIRVGLIVKPDATCRRFCRLLSDLSKISTNPGKDDEVYEEEWYRVSANMIDAKRKYKFFSEGAIGRAYCDIRTLSKIVQTPAVTSVRFLIEDMEKQSYLDLHGMKR